MALQQKNLTKKGTDNVPSGQLTQADDPESLVAQFGADEPLQMDAGINIAPWQIAYQTYGTLN